MTPANHACFSLIFTLSNSLLLFAGQLLINEYETGLDLLAGVATYIDFYNHRRPHQSLDYQTPAQVHFQSSQPYFNT